MGISKKARRKKIIFRTVPEKFISRTSLVLLITGGSLEPIYSDGDFLLAARAEFLYNHLHVFSIDG